eukprot:CAMPEP_0173310862 /NCGR_PEP_ID=MMETSP1143-20121109/23175_1 /TAXON_ID=483371 /ORGANISM="non described non described, Strain CCMP2298" /LENGTH=84 /DNA_ID=CAMNT_0014252719 /DNA_START=518 /DNA_END=773 /DNA_ORIENTATION=-
MRVDIDGKSVKILLTLFNFIPPVLFPLPSLPSIVPLSLPVSVSVPSLLSVSVPFPLDEAAVILAAAPAPQSALPAQDVHELAPI